MPVPVVEFTDERLPNGLRLIVAEDHLAPVVAVNVWYNVGSKHEVPGKTGFAHLFEHVMFQGSAHVGKAEHMALVQAAGGTLNGTTWLDRTNYYETLPSHQLELALWLEADRMGSLLDALSQENLDNQREVVKNEKRWSLRQPAVRDVEREAARPPVPRGPPVPPPDDRLDGGPRRGLARRRQGLLPDLVRAQQRGALGGRRLRSRPGARVGGQVLRPDPGQRGAAARCRTCRCPPLIGEERRETVEDRVPLPRVYIALPRAGLRRPPARRARPRLAAARRRQGEPAAQAPRPRGAAGAGRRRVHAAVHRRRVDQRGLGDGPAGRRHRDRGGRLPRGAGAAGVGAADATTSSSAPRR